MQRVRIGLTGLAAVFLLVMFAAAFIGLTRRDAQQDHLLGDNILTANAAESPAEPLAELGVAPGGQPEEPEVNQAAPRRIGPPAP